MDRRRFLGAAAAGLAAVGSAPRVAQATGWPARPRATGAAAAAQPRLALVDRFGRDVSHHGVQLVDWEGYIANPYIGLTVTGPADGLRYPLAVQVQATGTSRLMLDLPSELTAAGATKSLTLDSRTATATFRLAIHPRRGPGPDERHVLSLVVTDAAGVRLVQQTPILVQVDDKRSPVSPVPLVFDRRYDTITQTFADADLRTAAETAIIDWYDHFDLRPFDAVASGTESLTLPGNDWANPVEATNNAAYTGMWVFLRGIAEPYSTGFPSTNGVHHTRGGVVTPYARSTALILQFAANAQLFTSLADEDWWRSDLSRVVDVYGLAMHEYGHAIAFNHDWPGMAAYQQGGWASATTVIDYQGRAVPLDDSYHIPGDEPYWDRLSGQSGGWTHLFPTRRWMPTKLTLLIAESAGWKLDRTRTAFLQPTIVTTTLPRGRRRSRYQVRLQARGGVPFYDWRIVDGRLPPGLALDRFTGSITGYPGRAGKFPFVVELRDHDVRETPRTRAMSITVAG